MGLDISIRYRKLNTTPVESGFSGSYTCSGPNENYTYSPDDIKYGPDFNGRQEFRCIRLWVGDDRYGKWIALDNDTADDLIKTIHAELDDRAETDGDDYETNNDFPYWLAHDQEWGLPSLLAEVSKAKEFLRYGWIMEIECDW